MEKQILNIQDIKNFFFSKKPSFTLVSKKTRCHYTFKLNRKPNIREGKEDVIFVSHRIGEEYINLGIIFDLNKFSTNPKLNYGNDAKIVKTINWLLNTINKESQESIDMVEFYHFGKCARCGRTLTEPESIKTGIGPACRGK